MDILDLDTQKACDNSIAVNLVSPSDGKDIGIIIYVVGKDSKICQDYTRVRVDDALRKAYRAKQRGREIDYQTSDKLRDQEISFIAACTTGWLSKDINNNDTKKTITFGDEELVFNPSNAIKLYKRLPWIATQVDEAIGDLSLFMRT